MLNVFQRNDVSIQKTAGYCRNTSYKDTVRQVYGLLVVVAAAASGGKNNLSSLTAMILMQIAVGANISGDMFYLYIRITGLQLDPTVKSNNT